MSKRQHDEESSSSSLDVVAESLKLLEKLTFGNPKAQQALEILKNHVASSGEPGGPTRNKTVAVERSRDPVFVSFDELRIESKFSGNFNSDIFTAKWNKEGVEKDVVVKCPHQAGELLERELLIKPEFRHQHIVTLLGYGQAEKQRAINVSDFITYLNPKRQYVVFELMPSDLKKWGGTLTAKPNEDIWLVCSQIVSAMDHIHSLGYCHRDLKPANVLIDPRTLTIKLADFGNACEFGSNAGASVDELFYRASTPTPTDDVIAFGIVIDYLLSPNDPPTFKPKHNNEEIKSPLHFFANECKTNPNMTFATLKTDPAFFNRPNPYQSDKRNGALFSCGNVQTEIFVLDHSMTPEGYSRDNLVCLRLEEDEKYQMDLDAYPAYHAYLQEFQQAVEKKLIFNGTIMALKGAQVTRVNNESEDQKIVLKLLPRQYIEHKATQKLWKNLTEQDKRNLFPSKDFAQPHLTFSTSLGLHIVVLVAPPNPGDPPLFIFTCRSPAVSQSQQLWTCGAVEGMASVDVDPEGNPSVWATIERGLHEELGIFVKSDDHALRAFGVYLKVDTGEWGVAAAADLRETSPPISLETLRYNFQLNAKDKFETMEILDVPFTLNDMASFINTNKAMMASSTKYVAIKFMSLYFDNKDIIRALL